MLNTQAKGLYGTKRVNAMEESLVLFACPCTLFLQPTNQPLKAWEAFNQPTNHCSLHSVDYAIMTHLFGIWKNVMTS